MYISDDVKHFINALEYNNPYPYKTWGNLKYPRRVTDEIRKFITLLESYQGDEFISELYEYKSEYERISNCINEIIQNYLSGRTHESYQILDEKILKSTIIRKYWQHRIITIPETERLYRVRKSEAMLQDYKEMFHIPYKSRHLVKAQRYSLAGVPFLYLGSSLFVCLLETNRLNWNNTYMSCLAPRKEFKVLDLSCSLSSLLSNTEDQEQTQKHFVNNYKSYIATWPIVQACAFQKEFPNAPFNVEYIISNLILQWVLNNNGVIGLKYQSTHHNFKVNPSKGYNYAFPTIGWESPNEDYCSHLIECFKITSPISWQLAETIDSRTCFAEGNTQMQPTSNFMDHVLNNYHNTAFAKMENLISKDEKKFHIITN